MCVFVCACVRSCICVCVCRCVACVREKESGMGLRGGGG